jgi:hypothetical protein
VKSPCPQHAERIVQMPGIVSQTMKYLIFTGTFQKNIYTDPFNTESEATNVRGQVQAKIADTHIDR